MSGACRAARAATARIERGFGTIVIALGLELAIDTR
jgi:hypothetical protein